LFVIALKKRPTGALAAIVVERRRLDVAALDDHAVAVPVGRGTASRMPQRLRPCCSALPSLAKELGDRLVAGRALHRTSGRR
jgi:hypothetical protein